MRGFYLESRFVNQGFEAWSVLHWVWVDVGTQPGFKPLNAFEAVLSCYKNSTWAIDRWWMRLQSGSLTHPLILTKMPWVRWWAVLILQQFTAQGAIFVGPRRGRDKHQQMTHAFFIIFPLEAFGTPKSPKSPSQFQRAKQWFWMFWGTLRFRSTPTDSIPSEFSQACCWCTASLAILWKARHPMTQNGCCLVDTVGIDCNARWCLLDPFGQASSASVLVWRWCSWGCGFGMLWV